MGTSIEQAIFYNGTKTVVTEELLRPGESLQTVDFIVSNPLRPHELVQVSPNFNVKSTSPDKTCFSTAQEVQMLYDDGQKLVIDNAIFTDPEVTMKTVIVNLHEATLA